jgi:hypothetical protein
MAAAFVSSKFLMLFFFFYDVSFRIIFFCFVLLLLDFFFIFYFLLLLLLQDYFSFNYNVLPGRFYYIPMRERKTLFFLHTVPPFSKRFIYSPKFSRRCNIFFLFLKNSMCLLQTNNFYCSLRVILRLICALFHRIK